jgi:hypothetical protein
VQVGGYAGPGNRVMRYQTMSGRCGERDRLWRAFEQATEAFLKVVPDYKAGIHRDKAELAAAMAEASNRIDETRDAYIKHIDKHGC